MRRHRPLLALVVATALALVSCERGGRGVARDATGRFTTRAAWDWYARQGRLVGCDFVPSTAENQLEMWQAATFDPVTIDRELGYAEGIGFDVLRVFLHDKLWTQDPAGFVARIDAFLALADAHHMKTMLVLFDNVWNPTSALGPQPDPIPGVHNSQWVQSPDAAETIAFPTDPALRARLEGYVKGVVGAFRDDPRVLMWDILNEPGNSGIGDAAFPLMDAAFGWARELTPSQPLTAAPYFLQDSGSSSLHMIELSDVVTFHQYASAAALEVLIADLQMTTDRPLVCTEYMARPYGSTFQTHLPVFLAHGVGAISWGLVSGRTQTIYAWTSPAGSPEPALWFHDVFRADGTPFDAAEVDYLRATLVAP